MWKNGNELAIKIDDFNMLTTTTTTKKIFEYFYIFFSLLLAKRFTVVCEWCDRELWEWLSWKIILCIHVLSQGRRHRNSCLFFFPDSEKIKKIKMNFIYICAFITKATHHHVECFNVRSFLQLQYFSYYLKWNFCLLDNITKFIKEKIWTMLKLEKYLRFVTTAPRKVLHGISRII